MGSGRWFASVALLASVLVLVTLCGSGGPKAAASSGPGTPLVLVHGLTAGGPKVWGDRRADGKGLYGRLVRGGYVPGRTLFCYDYGETANADYASLALTGLRRVVERVLAATGADRVDLVTFGSGALVARYWVASQPGLAPLGKLVMIAPPNHGQFQADLLKVLYHTDRLVKAGLDTPGGAPAGLAPEGFPDPPDFTAEDPYVARRARDYTALYADYVLSARLLGETGDNETGSALPQSAAPPPSAFDAWIASERPDLAETWIYSAEEVPDPPGMGLTLAYYEMLSLRVGRQLYLAGVITAGRLPPLPPLEDLLSREWRSLIEDYLKQLVFDWGPSKARELWARSKAGLGLDLGALLTGFDPGGAAVSRLVPEYLAFPGPGGVPRATVDGARPVLCNGFLHDWQRKEATARPPGSCYVTIAGVSPSLLGLVGKQVGPNDLVVEAASAVTQPHPNDEFRLGRGLTWAHVLLAGNARLQSEVLEVLGPAGLAVGGWGTGGAGGAAGEAAGAAGEPAGGVVSGQGTARLWQPTYRPLGEATCGTGASVTVQAGDPGGSGLDGLTAVAWLAESGPDLSRPPVVLRQILLEPAEGGGVDPVVSGVLALPSESTGRLALGVRLVPDSGYGPGFLTMGRFLGRDVKVPFSYSVSRGVAAGEASPAGTDAAAGSPPAAGGTTAGAGPPTGGATAGESGEPGEADDGPSVPTGGTGSEPGEEPEPGSGNPDGSGGPSVAGRAEIVPTLEPPLISVIRVTKLTTDKREDRTFHARWEWDFGDGERLSDEDPSHTTVTVEHTFPADGPYTVSARSVANDGRVLRDLSWTVQAGQGAGPDGRTFSFQAETIVEPQVKLTIEGPVKWVTGKAARFEVKAEVSWPPRTRRQVIRAYPGWAFDVVWEKPGVFEVRAAITVKQSYEFPDQRLTVYNTYVTSTKIELFTPGLTE